MQRHKNGVATGGVLYAEKVNRTLDFDVLSNVSVLQVPHNTVVPCFL